MNANEIKRANTYDLFGRTPFGALDMNNETGPKVKAGNIDEHGYVNVLYIGGHMDGKRLAVHASEFARAAP